MTMAIPYFNDPAMGWNATPADPYTPTQLPGVLSGQTSSIGHSGPLSGSGGGFLGGLRGLLDPQYALPIAAQLIGGATPQASFAGALGAAGQAIPDMRQRTAINDWMKAGAPKDPSHPAVQALMAASPEMAQKIIGSQFIGTPAGDLTTDQRNFANAQKDPAFSAFLNRQKPGSDALEIGRYTLAANRAVKPYMELPVYKLAAQAAPMLSRIERAYTIPGSVPDQELLDSVTKLNNAGGQVTEAQVNLVLKGQSLADQAATWQQYLAGNGGVLSPDQRKQLLDVAHAVVRGYHEMYKPVYSAAVKAVRDRKLPEEYTSAIPDLDALMAAGGVDPQTGQAAGATPADGAPAAPAAGAPADPFGIR
jgi:hypothetical protein